MLKTSVGRLKTILPPHSGSGESSKHYPGINVFERDRALDGLRGIAVGLILLLHGFTLIPSGPVTRFLSAATASMYVGVDLFFVLSGFLITSILIRTRATPKYFTNFYARRALRIFPAYYLVLIGAYLLLPLGANPAWQAQIEHDFWFYLLYLQNVMMAVRGHAGAWVGLDHTWSLAVEEQFYLIWPALVMFTPPRHLLRTCLYLCALSVAVKLAMHVAGLPMWTQYVTTVTHAEGLALGSAVAAAVQIHARRQPTALLRGAGIAAGVYLLVIHPSWAEQHVLHSLWVAILFAWVVFEAVGSAEHTHFRRFLKLRPLSFLGRYSYGVYLLHYPVLMYINAQFGSTWRVSYGINAAVVLNGTFMVLMTMLLAIFMYHVVESPILLLKRHFSARPSVIAVNPQCDSGVS